MKWGDGKRAVELCEEIRNNTPLGRILASGAGLLGRSWVIERVPVVKNQAMSAYEPRAIKGMGVTFATTPQGADHTCGQTIRDKINHLDPAGSGGSYPERNRSPWLDMIAWGRASLLPLVLRSHLLRPFGIFINARYGWGVDTSIFS